MKNEKTCVIYRIYNIVNGKSYIGQTTNIKHRTYRHFSGKSRCTYINSAIKKFGKNSFKIEILESNVPQNLLNKFEILHIRFWNSCDNGYNLTTGGEGLKNPSAETRQKLSKASTGKISPNRGKIGKKHTEETRQRISEKLSGENHPYYGKKFSKETCQKMSESQLGEKHHRYGKSLPKEHRDNISKGTSGKNNPMYGKKHSEDTRRKISNARRGKPTRNKKKSSPLQLKLF